MNDVLDFGRRHGLRDAGLGLLAAGAVFASTVPAARTPRVGLRIGHEKAAAARLTAPGTLDQRLASLRVSVRRIAYPAAPQLLEALHLGAIDVAQTGAASTLFAQAAGADFVYIGHGPTPSLYLARRGFADQRPEVIAALLAEGIDPMTPAVVAAHQQLADTLLQRRQIAAPIDVAARVWSPPLHTAAAGARS